MALLSSGCRATVEGLPNVQNSSTTQQWQSYLAGWQLHVPCRQSSKHFISGQLKVIPLFRYSVIPYSAFYSVPPELHETGTIRKHWNRATIYVETKRVHEQLSEICALECGLKNCKRMNPLRHVVISQQSWCSFCEPSSAFVSCLQPSWTVGK